jgi:hypothetical protein
MVPEAGGRRTRRQADLRRSAVPCRHAALTRVQCLPKPSWLLGCAVDRCELLARACWDVCPPGCLPGTVHVLLANVRLAEATIRNPRLSCHLVNLQASKLPCQGKVGVNSILIPTTRQSRQVVFCLINTYASLTLVNLKLSRATRPHTPCGAPSPPSPSCSTPGCSTASP